MICHLKRFKITNYNQKKLSYCINIPFDISLDFLLKDKEKYKDNVLYNLSAVVVHVGTGNEYGHYYSLVKVSGKWVKFDDENVNVKYILDFNKTFLVNGEKWLNRVLWQSRWRIWI